MVYKKMLGYRILSLSKFGLFFYMFRVQSGLDRNFRGLIFWKSFFPYPIDFVSKTQFSFSTILDQKDDAGNMIMSAKKIGTKVGPEGM